MQADLSDQETAALLALLNRALDNYRFLLAPQSRSLQGIRRKILGAAPPPGPPQLSRGASAGCSPEFSRSQRPPRCVFAAVDRGGANCFGGGGSGSRSAPVGSWPGSSSACERARKIEIGRHR